MLLTPKENRKAKPKTQAKTKTKLEPDWTFGPNAFWQAAAKEERQRGREDRERARASDCAPHSWLDLNLDPALKIATCHS